MPSWRLCECATCKEHRENVDRLVKAAENLVAIPPIGSAMERWSKLNDAIAPFREKS